ncbi:prepilin-type N-terminal cleavage/methylation domain-containing protein [Clostridium chromiireducens]|uniref:Prepilin-type N-terminal cleavage/methylation domain-containing protein n=1 Tax=Clostridium chromiireducens TaxID=225345 RepID=A0A964RIY4_9CLOT|nr:prepilin-type N-terminal cleavage/methylation domain-containing protein [Clostridium chromiireducens]MVX62578.1 prepilin-type N-terminal cleavage/methylation domain-containing protein [Clostridium chromiireducens]
MQKKKKPGFTLMEMIIVVALIVIILAMTSSMFITGNKVFSNSDVKSTLQMEGQAIQEKISDIGMQGLNIETCKSSSDEIPIQNQKNEDIDDKLVDINGKVLGDREWIDLSELTIYACSKDSEYDNVSDSVTNRKVIPIIYTKSSKELSVDSSTISNHVDSIRIRPSNIKEGTSTIAQSSSIEFNIVLSKNKGFTNVSSYPIYFTVTLRNKVE